MQSYIGPDELIYNNDVHGNIHSGGFNVNSIMMKNDMSPIMTWNASNASQVGGALNVSDLFNNLVIPNWTLSYNYKHLGGMRDINKKKQDLNDDDDDADDVITEELHEKLLNLVKASEDEINKIKKTKKTNNTKKYNKLNNNKKFTKKNKDKDKS